MTFILFKIKHNCLSKQILFEQGKYIYFVVINYLESTSAVKLNLNLIPTINSYNYSIGIQN